jgi:hypothetical protein
VKTDPTIDTAPVRQWFEILSKFGADRARLLQLLECDEDFLRECDNRIATRCHHAMLHFGAREIDIPGIVLLAGAKTTAQSMGVVGHLMMNCETLLAAGHQIVPGVYPGTHTLPFTLIDPKIRLAQPQANGINSITYRIAVESQAGARCSPKAPTVGTLQTLPVCELDEFTDTAGRVSGFSLHAGVAARADERKKLERLSEGGPDVTSVGQPLRKNAYR